MPLINRCGGGSAELQSKTVDMYPSFTGIDVVADAGYDGLAKVTVNPVEFSGKYVSCTVESTKTITLKSLFPYGLDTTDTEAKMAFLAKCEALVIVLVSSPGSAEGVVHFVDLRLKMSTSPSTDGNYYFSGGSPDYYALCYFDSAYGGIYMTTNDQFQTEVKTSNGRGTFYYDPETDTITIELRSTRTEVWAAGGTYKAYWRARE